MLNFLHPKSRLVLSVILITAASATFLSSPAQAEDTTINVKHNVEQSTYISPNLNSSAQELIDLLNSDDLKFSLSEQTYHFAPSVLNTNLNLELEKNSFTQANQYSLQEDFRVSEFEQMNNVDFAFIFDFAQ